MHRCFLWPTMLLVFSSLGFADESDTCLLEEYRLALTKRNHS